MNLEAVKKRALTTSTPSSWDGRRRASRRFLRRTGGPLPAVTLGPRAEGPEQATERLPWMLGSSPLLSGLDFSTMRASQRGRSCSQKESRWGRPRRKSQRSLLFRRANGPKRTREPKSRPPRPAQQAHLYTQFFLSDTQGGHR